MSKQSTIADKSDDGVTNDFDSNNNDKNNHNNNSENGTFQ